jgi:hypothetical protein
MPCVYSWTQYFQFRKSGKISKSHFLPVAPFFSLSEPTESIRCYFLISTPKKTARATPPRGSAPHVLPAEPRAGAPTHRASCWGPRLLHATPSMLPPHPLFHRLRGSSLLRRHFSTQQEKALGMRAHLAPCHVAPRRGQRPRLHASLPLHARPRTSRSTAADFASPRGHAGRRSVESGRPWTTEREKREVHS